MIITGRDIGEIEYLGRFFSYDRESGEIAWRVAKGGMRPGDIAGWIDTTGYVVVCLDQQVIYGHRLAWALETGSWPEDEIDHENGVRNDNRWANLRSVAGRDNQKNMKKARNNTSGATGVSFNHTTGRWVASIGLDNETVYLGAFRRKSTAIEVRKGAERRFGFHPNHGRDA